MPKKVQKVQAPILTPDEKTAFLETIKPNGTRLERRFYNRQFDGWNIYRFHSGAFSGIRNFFELEPMAILTKNMDSLLTLEGGDLILEIETALVEGIWKRFQIFVNCHGVPPYMR